MNRTIGQTKDADRAVLMVKLDDGRGEKHALVVGVRRHHQYIFAALGSLHSGKASPFCSPTQPQQHMLGELSTKHSMGSLKAGSERTGRKRWIVTRHELTRDCTCIPQPRVGSCVLDIRTRRGHLIAQQQQL